MEDCQIRDAIFINREYIAVMYKTKKIEDDFLISVFSIQSGKLIKSSTIKDNIAVNNLRHMIALPDR